MIAALPGGCFCGAVRFRISGSISQACYCHCESCRRAAGAPYVAWCTVESDRFVVTTGHLTLHASSPKVSRGFCATCGTSITYAHDARPGEIDVTIATLDDPEHVAPTRHIWLIDKLPWVEINDALPKFEGFSSQG